MTRARWLERSAVVVGLALVVSAFVRPAKSSATAADVLEGEGDSSAQPLVSALQKDATAAIAPLSTSLATFNLDLTRDDFASGAVDFAVTELPLTHDEAATAASNGRSFAYVPFAVTGVALGAVVAQSNDRTVQANTFYRNLELTAAQVADLFTSTVNIWNSPTYTQPGATQPLLVTSQSGPVTPLFLVDPNAATPALISYILSDPHARTIWNTWVVGSQKGTADTVTERWPTNGGLPAGDYTLASKLVPIDPATNLPLVNPQQWGQGDVGPLPVEWVGPPRNVPTVALQNAAGAFVGPTIAGESAALTDATVDPNTNLVTFKPGTTDTAAYPIAVMEYLLVPTTGLSSAKAKALAGFMRFVLGPSGQADIKAFGAAPVSDALSRSGLAVADVVASEGSPTSTSTTSSSSPTTSSSSTTSTLASTPTTTGGAGTGPTTGTTVSVAGASSSVGGADVASSGGVPPAASGSSGGGAGAGEGLAFTGGGSTAASIGGSLVLAGTLGRRLFARRLRRLSGRHATPAPRRSPRGGAR